MTIVSDVEVAVAHRLTEDERDTFERDGYLMLRGVVPGETRSRLVQVAQRIDDEFRARPGVTAHHVLNRHDLVEVDDAFLDLVDLPTVFPKVFGILGWNIQLFHTQLVVTPPTHPDAPAGGYGWHQDNNRMNIDFETPPPHPRVSVKVGYFLTDLPRPGMGQPLRRARQPPLGADRRSRCSTSRTARRRSPPPRATPSCSTGASGTPRARTSRTRRACSSRTATRTGGCARSRRCSTRRSSGAATRSAGSCWGRPRPAANGYFDPTDDDVAAARLDPRAPRRRGRRSLSGCGAGGVPFSGAGVARDRAPDPRYSRVRSTDPEGPTRTSRTP
ncbi:MAG: hypothetical protein KatS3mg010_0266 [Acidimicrobiia bacterium]|nr:MAG: hypothetical protein KatS3mg010_0266 [Acidimicrobiia bacterium]